MNSDDKAIDRLQDSYQDWTRLQLRALRHCLQCLEQQPSDAHRAEIFSLSHNIKGLGGSFGYFLMTDIATLLCQYTMSPARASDLEPTIIAAHIAAMEQVLTGHTTAGPEAPRILAGLREMVRMSLDS